MIPGGIARFGPWLGRKVKATIGFVLRRAFVSQEVIEVLDTADPAAYVSQEVVESFNTATPVAYVSQEVIESFNTADPLAYCTQLVVEVLQPNIEVPMLPIYPDNLPGLAFNVKWTPQFYNMPTQITASGAQLDLAYADTPTHEFELIYEFLRDSFGQTEFKKMMGFFLRLGGTVGRFLFNNPDDHTATAETVDTTDGVNVRFGPIVRTFGVGSDVGSEPVGYIDETAPVKVYLDGVQQGSATWQLDQTTPGDIYVRFNSVPTVGQVITMDFDFFYYCKFGDNILSFEKFMNQIWSLSSVRIITCRPGA